MAGPFIPQRLLNPQTDSSLFVNARILIVDDDPAICDILSSYFRDLGVQCQSCRNSREAAELIRQNDFDAILSDIYMPGMTGHDLLAIGVEYRPLTPFVLMTGNPNLENAIRAIRLGAYDYITKPFHLDFVYLTLNRALHYRRLALQNRAYQENLEQQVEERTRELSEFLFLAVQSLSHALEARDPYTQGHATRVSHLVIRVAKEMGVDEKEFPALRLAAQLHDIGKIGVPDSILQKKGKLTDAEYEVMKDHVNIGHKILSPIPSLKEVSRYVHEHHERVDGRGYPRGLTREQIHPHSRILMAVEVCDALATERCYKEAWELPRIIAYFRDNAGTAFDPDVAEALIQVLETEGGLFLKSWNDGP